MADTKISALPSSTLPLTGTEPVPIVQSSTTKRVSVSDLTSGRTVDMAAATIKGNASFYESTGASVRAKWDSVNKEFIVGNSTGAAGAGFTVTSPNDDAISYLLARGASGLTTQHRYLNKNTAGTNTGGAIGHIGDTGLVLTASSTSIDAAQNVIIDSSANLKVSTGNLVIGTAGKGIADSSGTQKVYVNTTGVGIGVTPFGNVGAFSVSGTSSITDGTAGGTSTDLVQRTSSITTATTILTNVAPNLSSAAASYILVYGSNNAGAYFFDVLVCVANAASATVLSSTTLGGSPAARTYALSGGALTLAMASGTYNVMVKATALGYPF